MSDKRVHVFGTPERRAEAIEAICVELLQKPTKDGALVCNPLINELMNAYNRAEQLT